MRKRTLAAAAVASTLALGGCSLGSDDEDETAAPAPSAQQQPTSSCRDVASGARTAIVAPTFVVVREWRIDDENLQPALGCVVSDGDPVEGARISVNNYVLPELTDEHGGFHFPIDVTLPQRAIVRVVDATNARAGGDELSESRQASLRRVRGQLVVRFRMSELEAERNGDGTIRVSGRASYDDGSAPPEVVLAAYELSGRVVDPEGSPLEDAIVATRSLDLELWSFSPPSAADGSYRSFFLPSGDDPDRVGFTLRVAVGDDLWELAPNQVVFFEKLKSAHLDIQVPPPGFALVPERPTSYRGAIYEGLLVGVTIEGEPLKPLSARWVDPDGRFELVLPSSTAGETVRFWQSRLYAFSRVEAEPGAEVDLAYWPEELPQRAPRELDQLKLPG
jgi:hypothetical protein